MTTPRRHRLVSLAGSLLLAVSAVLFCAQAAPAASHNGEVWIKVADGYNKSAGNSSAYFSTTAAKGGSATYTIAIKNTGSVPSQYRVLLNQFTGSPPAAGSANLFSGTTNLGYVAFTDGYYTKLIPGGGTETLTLKTYFDPVSAQGSYYGSVTLYALDGAYLGVAYAQSEVTAPLHGTGAHDLFLKGRAGTVGGSVSGQVAASAGLTLGKSAAFTVKLQNDGSAASQTGIVVSQPESCVTMKVLDGTKDITSLVTFSGYFFPSLAPGRSKTLKVTVTQNSSNCTASFARIDVRSLDTNGTTQVSGILIAPYVNTA